MGATITLRCGSGVAAITYAWVNASGNRTPSDGSATLTSTQGAITLTNCDHVWVNYCSAKTHYEAPYYVKFETTTVKTSDSATINYSYYPSTEGEVTVEASYTVSYVTANLKCGTGIASYQVFYSNGGVARTISSKSYVSFNLIKGDEYTLGNIQYETGYSGVKWYYNSSAGVAYEDQSTIKPDYVLNSSYDRYGYFEATTYTPPVTYYTCSATYYSGCQSMFSSITVNGEPSVQVARGNTATWRCKVKSGYTFMGWYDSSDNRVSTNTTYTVDNIQYGRTYYARAQVSSYIYYFRINLYIDGALYDYATDSKSSTSSTGTTLSLATAQSYFSIGSEYSFSYAAAGTNCTYTNEIFTLISTDSSSRSVCNLYYVSDTYSAHAYSTGFESCFSSVSVSNSSPTYGSSITFKAVLSNSFGYTFLGWYNGTGSGASRLSQNLSYTHTVTGSVTLYARARVKWTYSHAAGTKQISKEEWDRVQAFIHDRNGAIFSYTAIAGNALSKDLYNDTKDAIGTGVTVKKGQAITQALLDALVTNANNL